MFELKKHLLFSGLLSVALLAGCDKAASSDGEDEASGAISENTMETSGNDAETSGNAGANGGDAVAVVNGKSLSAELYEVYAQQRAASVPNAPIDPNSAIQDMVSREVVYQEALEQGLDEDPKVLAQMANQERNILANAALQNYLETHPISDESLQKEFEATKDSAAKEYKAKHILVSTEQEAEDIIAKLGEGADFATLASEESMDPGSGENGGDLGWFKSTDMVGPFADAVIALEKGTYTESPVKSQFGWHIILLEDTRAKETPSFEEAKEGIRGVMVTEQLQEYLDGLKAEADIEIKEVAQANPVIVPEMNPEANDPQTPADSGTAAGSPSPPANMNEQAAPEENPQETDEGNAAMPAADNPGEEQTQQP